MQPEAFYKVSILIWQMPDSGVQFDAVPEQCMKCRLSKVKVLKCTTDDENMIHRFQVTVEGTQNVSFRKYCVKEKLHLKRLEWRVWMHLFISASKEIPTMSISVRSFFLHYPFQSHVTTPHSSSLPSFLQPRTPLPQMWHGLKQHLQSLALWRAGSKSSGDIRHALGVDRIMPYGY